MKSMVIVLYAMLVVRIKIWLSMERLVIVQLFRDIKRIFVQGVIPYVIIDEAKNMLISYLSLLKPPVTNLDLEIGNLRDYITQLSSNLMPNPETEIEKKRHRHQNLLLKTTQMIIDTYREYCSKFGYESPILI